MVCFWQIAVCREGRPPPKLSLRSHPKLRRLPQEPLLRFLWTVLVLNTYFFEYFYTTLEQHLHHWIVGAFLIEVAAHLTKRFCERIVRAYSIQQSCVCLKGNIAVGCIYPADNLVTHLLRPVAVSIGPQSFEVFECKVRLESRRV